MGDRHPVSLAAIPRVLSMVEREGDGDHSLSHYLLARKVLGESPAFALRVGRAFAHRRLTRADCERVAVDWDETGEGND